MIDTPSPVGGPRFEQGMIYQRCWNCDPMGQLPSSGSCDAKALLERLNDDLELLARNLADHEAEAGVAADARKSARYFMYRKWVGEQWGHLGKGARIRIPPCVVEAIRDQFRAPGCTRDTCPLGGPLFNCTAHNYTGHRDAP